MGYSSALGFAIFAGAMAISATSQAQNTALQARGKYLAAVGICSSCHTPKSDQGEDRPGSYLGGGHRVGGILASNITPDKETGIGNWTDQQIVDAIRNGKRPNGEPVRPPMGVFFYRTISDDDMRAIVAYLRSVPAVTNKVERVEGRGPAPTYERVEKVAAPEKTDRLAYGKYIGESIAHCFQCHTPRKDGQPDLTRLGAGGNTYTARGGGQVTSSNITPAALASWTDEQIKAAITKGVRPDGGQLAAVMDFDLYGDFAKDDLDALVAYMRSLPAAK